MNATATTGAHAGTAYRPDIEGLRGFAVFLVVVFHAFPSILRSGFIGVDVFFVISGYLITGIIANDLAAARFTFAGFYQRRIRRIFPALVPVLAVSLALGWFALFAGEFEQLGKHVAAGALFVANHAFLAESGYFDKSALAKPLLHLWSLAVEEQFYIVWPLLLWLCRHRLGAMASVAVLGFMASFLLNVVLVRTHPDAAFYLAASRAWEPLAGAILALHERSRRTGASQRPAAGTWWGIAGFACLVVSLSTVRESTPYPGWHGLLPVAGTCLLLHAGASGWFNRTVLASAGLRWVGRISYPMYLWHWPVIVFASMVSGQTWDNRPMRLASVLVVVVLAWATERWIERPLRFGADGRRIVRGLCLAMAALALCGGLVWWQQGLPKRAPLRGYTDHSSELRVPALNDAGCLARVPAGAVPFPFCRYRAAGGTGTIAVIGDSHAFAAFEGLSESFARHRINTWMIGDGGCPLLVDQPLGEKPPLVERCRQVTREALRAVADAADVGTVVMLSRGGYYLSDTPAKPSRRKRIAPGDFRTGLQATIDRLASAGKRVFYVIENPELPHALGACLPRPMHPAVQSCDQPVSAVAARQASYLSIVGSLERVAVLDATAAFCPSGTCSAFADERLLYADRDHLSRTGSRLLAQALVPRILAKRKCDAPARCAAVAAP